MSRANFRAEESAVSIERRRNSQMKNFAIASDSHASDRSGLLDRILNTPGLEHLVPRLRPDLLHRVIQSCGLEDCAEIVALATPQQLARIFDLDLWRAAKAGRDEQFD